MQKQTNEVFSRFVCVFTQQPILVPILASHWTLDPLEASALLRAAGRPQNLELHSRLETWEQQPKATGGEKTPVSVGT